MGIKSIALAATTLVLSTSVNAVLIDNGSYTTDDENSLDWLDITETAGYSYEYVSSQLVIGGQFEGWTYASIAQTEELFDSAGGVGPYDPGYFDRNRLSADLLLDLWGTTVTGSYEQVWFLMSDIPSSGTHAQGIISIADWQTNDTYLTTDYGWQSDTYASPSLGHALVRVSAVPIPAAVWLFGSGLLGLVGVARRKKA